ncbi:MAG: ribosomal protein S18-alanine N-acetyltransferase [Gemmatimonadales bacterium]|nr:ribosomal protein S18-alanine N-acetyltransferase [Gemmatimonadales bacterium]
MDVPWRIRRARIADTDHVAQIEAQSFTDPWPREGVRAVLSSRTVTAFVAESGTRVIAYAIARDAAGVAEILDLAVSPEFRRAGVATALLCKLIETLERGGVRDIFLEVRESNRAARALYMAHGFSAAGRRPRYYRKPVEDAMLLKRGGPAHASERAE